MAGDSAATPCTGRLTERSDSELSNWLEPSRVRAQVCVRGERTREAYGG